MRHRLLGINRGTQSDAFLGITTKVREFEQVTDISIDKLDEFSAQTQHTAEELGKLTQQELAGFGDALFDVVNTIDTLTPMDGSNLGVSDLTTGNARTGRLAVNTCIGPSVKSCSGDRCYCRHLFEYHQRV